MNQQQQQWDVIVVGGGIAGWIAAVYAAKGGKRVLLAEKANTFGGRAATVVKEGVALNLGAHAVYRDGELPAALKELGIELEGGVPAAAGHCVYNGSIHTLPGSPMSLITSSLLTWRGKLELGRILVHIKNMDTRRLPTGTLSEWAERHMREPEARHLFYALSRTSTYVHQPDIQLAGPVLRQLKHVLGSGALYVNDGWQSIINLLRQRAAATGRVEAVNGKAVRAVKAITVGTMGVGASLERQITVGGRKQADAEHHATNTSPSAAAESSEPGRRFRVEFADGSLVEADAVILAVPPAECCAIVPDAEHTSLGVWRKQARPVTAACLDLVMRKLSKPRIEFVMGIDAPFLFTNQSRAATLSRNGLLAVSVLKYHGAAQPDAQRDKADMERTLDLLQPGWREHTAAHQFLPRMTVVHDYAHTGRTTLPGPAVPEIPGLYVAGDWAGHHELLVDASAASAQRAAEACLAESRQPVTS